MTTKAKVAKLGADPEFAFVSDNGEIAYAGGIVLQGQGAFGTDGNPDIAEIRPGAAWNAAGLVERLRETFTREIKRNPKVTDYEWHAGAAFNRNGLGGHIHFGMPYSAKFVAALDVLMALPMMMMEDAAEAKVRKFNYGHAADYELKPWGFEYRTLSSWLSSERKAMAVLSVAQVLCRLFLQSPEKLDELVTLAGGPLTAMELGRFNRHQVNLLARRIAKSQDALSAMLKWAETRSTRKEVRKAVVDFVTMSRNGVIEKKMNWTLNDVAANKVWQEKLAKRNMTVAEKEAKRAVELAAVAGVSFAPQMTMVQAFGHQAWTTPVTMNGITFEAHDFRLSDILGTMAGAHGSFVTEPRFVAETATVRAFGRTETALAQVEFRVGRGIDLSARVRLGDLVTFLRSRGVSSSIVEADTFGATVAVGLRRDLRTNQDVVCRAVVGTTLLLLNGAVSLPEMTGVRSLSEGIPADDAMPF